jgi:hypothetical protein
VLRWVFGASPLGGCFGVSSLCGNFPHNSAINPLLYKYTVVIVFIIVYPFIAAFFVYLLEVGGSSLGIFLLLVTFHPFLSP